MQPQNRLWNPRESTHQPRWQNFHFPGAVGKSQYDPQRLAAPETLTRERYSGTQWTERMLVLSPNFVLRGNTACRSLHPILSVPSTVLTAIPPSLQETTNLAVQQWHHWQNKRSAVATSFTESALVLNYWDISRAHITEFVLLYAEDPPAHWLSCLGALGQALSDFQGLLNFLPNSRGWSSLLF